MSRLAGQVAVVTGGSRGIGRAIAVALAREGCSVVINYHTSAEAAQQVVDEIQAGGAKAVAVQADVSIAEQAQLLLDRAVQLFGTVDILVNNAGITRDTLLMRMSEADWDAVLDTNLKGAYLCLKAAQRIMLRKRSGRIIQISSVSGVRGNAGQANYAAAKAGLIGLTKSAARELAPRNITVNAVAPGFIETDMTRGLGADLLSQAQAQIPLGRLGSPEDVAAAVVFLASPQAAYITGQVLCVDGGLAM
jgi:3-oxoacyl-[acyl-carrier protein] reductase